TPSERRRSLPAKRYFQRYHLPPRGLTSTYRPPPSKSLNDRSRALTERIAVSASGTWGQPLSLRSQLPQQLPHIWGQLPPDDAGTFRTTYHEKPLIDSVVTGCSWTSPDVLKVEAEGIEPSSESHSPNASTCVSDDLSSSPLLPSAGSPATSRR